MPPATTGDERAQLEAAVAALQAQRALLGAAVVEAGVGVLRAKLAALSDGPATEPAQQLRQVTILFLDVVGSTALSGQLDPEEILAVMDGALARCTQRVEDHGGKVLQYAGDSLLAVFGADETREDDAERAVRCGLALLAEGLALGAEVRQAHGHDGFDVRVGIHTGGVLLGGGVDAEASIRGMAVNIAARMEQSAPPGALRISHDTYAQVRGVFDVEPQAPIVVKGVGDPVLTYLVQRAKPRAFRVASRGIEGVETRMIGRDAELAQLQLAFEGLHREGAGLAAITVVAEAGIGKSRLLYEFGNWAEARPERFSLFLGRATPQTQGQPYGLLRDLLAARLEIADTDSAAAAKEKLEQGIAPLFEADDGPGMAQAHAHLLGHLVGLDFSESPHLRGILDDPRQIRSRGFHAAAQMFRRMTVEDGTPAVVHLDDLHWADDASLDFLEHLAQANRDVPMLLVGLTRPALFERREGWGTAWRAHRRIDLAPLGPDDSLALADELLKKVADVPTGVRELITGRVEGNPFYMEELVKMLIDQGAIETGAGGWTLHPEKLGAAGVPATLTGVLQARLDGLAAAEKLALQQASVIGLVFWDAALAALDAGAPAALPALAKRRLVVRRAGAAVEGAAEYVFCHQILHQVTYETVLRRSRRAWHAQAARWLAGLRGPRASDFLGATAGHFEKAGETGRACEFYAGAAEHAAARHAHGASREFASRALALATDDGLAETLNLRWRLHDVRERALYFLGLRPAQHADIAALAQLADAMNDDTRRADAALRLGANAMYTGDYRACEVAARKAVALAERAGSVALKVKGLSLLAYALSDLGDPLAGRTVARDALATARTHGLRREEARLLTTLSVIALIQGDALAMLEANEQVLQIARALGERALEANALSNLGSGWLALGEHARAQRLLEEGLQLVRVIGVRHGEFGPLINLSQLALWRGDGVLAHAHAQGALAIAIAVHDPYMEALGRCHVGNAEESLDRHAAAAFEQARVVAAAIDSPVRLDAVAGLARAALARGDTVAALQHAQEIVAHLAGGGSLEGTHEPRRIELTCHRVLAAAGDPGADALLEAAHRALQAAAASITDNGLRQGFLDNTPEHREIIAAWAARPALRDG
jgi:class 3 adenylate cyclase/tetratricopeptide (TPR) repeat protein